MQIAVAVIVLMLSGQIAFAEQTKDETLELFYPTDPVVEAVYENLAKNLVRQSCPDFWEFTQKEAKKAMQSAFYRDSVKLQWLDSLEYRMQLVEPGVAIKVTPSKSMLFLPKPNVHITVFRGASSRSYILFPENYLLCEER